VIFLKNIKKNFFIYFVFFFTLLGIYFSLLTGITHDEQYDLYVWQANQNIILNTIFNEEFDTSFLTGGSKYYGSGFHLLSFPIENLIQKIPFILNFDLETNILLSKHASVFIFFIVSSFFVRKILKLITENNLCSNIGSVFYLLYPYLLGHSFFNIKDIPFLSVWLICTYLIIKITKIFLEKNIIKKKHLFFLSFLTAYLLSIRISGILIFIQYLVFLIVSTQSSNIDIIKFIKKFKKEILLSSIFFVFFFILIQPNYWVNPFQFIDAIKFMSKHLQTVCTLTLGDCMKAQDLPASYIFIWLFFKLPLIILFGFILYPFVEKKFKQNSFFLITIHSLIISSASIVILLIIFEVNLYDEIRQIMFLVPLLIIISLSLIFHFSKFFFKISITLFIIFFIFQNVSIYPYNYIWINNFSHITKINGVFELDYWGVGSRATAEQIYKDSKKIDNCVVSIRPNGIKPFVKGKQCILNLNNLHNKIQRPFYVSLTERSLRKGIPNNCDLIFSEKRKINFSNEELVLAKLYKCK
jgi:hypothetical protein